MEAEYIALSIVMHYLIPLQTLTDELKYILDPSSKMLPCTTFSIIFEDNHGALTLAASPRMTQQSKHIMVKYHFFKDHIQQSNAVVQIAKVATDDQVTDCMTKGLDRVKFQHAHCMLAGW